MIREFEFRLNYNNRNISKKRNKQSYDDAKYFGLEFFYLCRYFQRKLQADETIQAMKKNTPKEKQILYLYFGINYEIENIRFNDKSRILLYDGLFDYTQITAVRNTNQRADILLNALAKDIHKCEDYIKGITDIMHDIIAEFRQDNYKNVWEFDKKRIKGVGTAKLFCQLTPLRFYLRFIVEDKNKEVIFNQLIFTSLPDSICYHYRFKSIVVNEKDIIITQRRTEKPLYTINIDEIVKGNMITEPFRKEPMPRWLIDFEKTIDYPDHVRYDGEYP